MLSLKITDRCLTILFYLFLVLAVVSILGEIYENFTDVGNRIDLRSTYTFIVFAFLAKYQYAIQYWLRKIDKVNVEERKRQLRIGEIEEK